MRLIILAFLFLFACQSCNRKSLPTCDDCKILTLKSTINNTVIDSIYTLRPYLPSDSIRYLNFDSLTTSLELDLALKEIWNSSLIKIFTNSSRKIGRLLFLKASFKNRSTIIVTLNLVTNQDALVPLYTFQIFNFRDVTINESQLFPDKFITLEKWENIDSIRKVNPLPE